MGADNSAENTPNAQFVCNFNEKGLHWASVVHGFTIFIISKTVGDVQIVVGFSTYLK